MQILALTTAPGTLIGISAQQGKGKDDLAMKYVQ